MIHFFFLHILYKCRKSGSRTYDVTMDDAAIIGGGFGYPLEELGSKFELELL